MPKKELDKSTQEGTPAGPPVAEMLLPGTELPEEKEGQWVQDEMGARKFIAGAKPDIEVPTSQENMAKVSAMGLGLDEGVSYVGDSRTFNADAAVGLAVGTAKEMDSALRAELLGEIARVRDQIRSEISDRGLSLQMVGGIFNCPVCGLRLDSPSLTGMKGGRYEHPFGTSPQLGGVQCKYIGRKFKPPVVFLEFSDLPLTAKSE